MAKTKLIIANWKMNPETEIEAKDALNKIKAGLKKEKGNKVVICPPFVFIDLVKKSVGTEKEIVLGAQDVFIGQGNSHTGEVSIDMLKELGVKYVIVGHSERKAEGETDEIITKKLAGVIKNGLKVILCIGEKERNDHGDYYHEIKRQLHSSLDGVTKKSAKNIIIAYEPVWAIGTGQQPTAEDVVTVHQLIRKILGNVGQTVPVLYGGSVNAGNAASILREDEVDGVLVGSASLNADSFWAIAEKCG